jgi:hypothetical protein
MELPNFNQKVEEFQKQFVRLGPVDIGKDLQKLDRKRTTMNVLEFISGIFLKRQFKVHKYRNNFTPDEIKKQSFLLNGFSKYSFPVPRDWILSTNKKGLAITISNDNKQNKLYPTFVTLQFTARNTFSFQVDFGLHKKYLLDFFQSPLLPNNILLQFLVLFRDFKLWLNEKGTDSNLAEMIIEFTFPFIRSKSNPLLQPIQLIPLIHSV